MNVSFLLIHSPLLGPSSVLRLAETVQRAGLTAVVPDLRSALVGGPLSIRHAVGEAAKSVEGRIALVGHSGAGAYLPWVGEQFVDRLGAMAFVDAVVPPEAGVFETADSFHELLDANTEQGSLRRWIDWWPPEVVGEILPSGSDRDELTSDMPIVPRAFYGDPIPVPDGWSSWPSVYLQTGGAYTGEIGEARRRSWPSRSISGTHLSLFTDPAGVYVALESLLAQLGA